MEKKIVLTALVSLLLLSWIVGSTFIALVSAELVHDVAVVNVKTYSPVHGPPGSPLTPVTACYPAWTVYINVTAKNEGGFNESFSVEAFYGNATGNYTTGITPASYSVTLDPGANTTKTFTWDVPDIPKVYPYWNYTIYGNATLAGDMVPENNVKAANVVTVKWPGDAFPPAGDGKVNTGDFGTLCKSYKKRPGDPKYNPQCDFTGDGIPDAPDFGVIAKNWKKGPLD